MKEIKFRAWLKEEEKMVNVKTMDFTDKTIRCLKKNEFINAYLLRRVSFYDRRIKHISPVFYMESQASYGVLDIHKNEIPLYTISANNYFEVIGNIYENKNLLEENNW